MTRKKATIKDIIEVMMANKDSYPGFMELSKAKQRALARLNVQTGVAQSYYLDGQLVAVGGIRMIGLGEAWLAVDPNAKLEHKKLLMRQTRKELKDAKEQGVWCIFAENSMSENFLKHLGFKKKTMYVRTA